MPPAPSQPAQFIDRPNRFLIRCRLGERIIQAFLPNPGRLWELLLPGVTVYLVEEPPSPTRKNAFTAVAVEREGVPIFLHTHRTNEVAGRLIDQGKVPGLERGPGDRPGDPNRPLPLRSAGGTSEKGMADRGQILHPLREENGHVSRRDHGARGSRHLRELAELSDLGRRTAVLFIVHWLKAEYFLPDYHTDLFFAQTFLACRNRVEIIPLAVEWKPDLSLGDRVKRLEIPWELIQREAQDRGSYLLILKLNRKMNLEFGRKENRQAFPAGYYVYVGSAMKNLTQRLERHRRLRKNKFWHIDYLREASEFIAALPVRSSEDLECQIAERMRAVADWAIPGFGASDCACPGHLFGMREDPLGSYAFIGLLQYFRMDRLF